MKKIHIISILFSVLIFNSCDKNKDQLPGCEIEGAGIEYIIFGHFFGECGGEECIETYKIQNCLLYENSADQYPGVSNAEGQWVQLDTSKFSLVKSLLNEIPQEYYSNTEAVLGMPDAGDWGGYFVEIKSNGEVQKTLIDNMENNIPAWAAAFKNNLAAKIELIQ